MNLPPIFFYGVGAALAVFGGTRALLLGRRRPDRELGDDTPARAKARRNHLVFGLVHFVFGVGLILMTAGVIQWRAGH
jgi:hypothetical protein